MADRVIFRAYPDREVIALFPGWPADNEGRLCHSYLHIGQGGGADYSLVVRQTRPATPEEYQELAEELRSRGYTLEIRKRRNWRD